MDEPAVPRRKLKHRRAAAQNLFAMFCRNCGMGIDLLLFDNPDLRAWRETDQCRLRHCTLDTFDVSHLLRDSTNACFNLLKLLFFFFKKSGLQSRQHQFSICRDLESPSDLVSLSYCLHGSLSVVTRLAGRCFTLRFGNLHVLSSDLLILWPPSTCAALSSADVWGTVGPF